MMAWHWPVDKPLSEPMMASLLTHFCITQPHCGLNRMDSVCIPLRWRHNGRDSVSNHQPHDCLLNCLFRRRSKKTSKLHVTGLCVGNSPGTGEFPAQMASNAENVSMWWHHYDILKCNVLYLVQISLKFVHSNPIGKLSGIGSEICNHQLLKKLIIYGSLLCKYLLFQGSECE